MVRAMASGSESPGPASDDTTVLSLAGVLAVGGTAGVGVGVDVEVVH